MAKPARPKTGAKTKRPPIAERALVGVREAGAYLRGDHTAAVVHEPVDVAAIRKSTGLSQPQFAETFGMSVGALRDWEQGRKAPERMARTLLRIVERNPKLGEVAARDAA